MTSYQHDSLSYQEIKFEILNGLYDDFKNNFYRKKLLESRFSSKEILAKLYDDFEPIYEKPIEKLMFYTVFIILNEGCNVGADEYYRSEFNKIVNQNGGLDDFIQEVSREDVELFLRDLEIIGLIPEDLA